MLTRQGYRLRAGAAAQRAAGVDTTRASTTRVPARARPSSPETNAECLQVLSSQTPNLPELEKL